MRRLISLLLIITILSGMTVAVAADLGTGTVKGGWLRLRSAPSTLGAVIGRYYTGTKVTVHSAAGSWYYVTAPDGKVGFMSRNYITLKGAPAPVSPGGGWSGVPSGETGYVTSQNGRGVRLRSSPSSASSANVIGLYSVGTKLTVLQRGSGWHYIQIGSQTGFMMSQFIVINGKPGPTPPSPVPDKNYTAYITSQNGKGVRLRTGPGTNYSLLGTFPVGTKVTVLKELGAWSYIEIGKKKGYMMSTFLTRKSPQPEPPPYNPPIDPAGTIESAQITIQSPIIGDKLYVYVLPDSAEYNVLWYNDGGSLLGTGNGYTVKNSDKGHRIRARVTGRGKWAGSVYTLYTDIIGQVTPIGPEPHQTLTGTIKLPTVVYVDDVLTAQVYDCNATALSYTWYVDALQYAQKNTITVTTEMVGKTIQVVVTASGFSNSLTAVTTAQAAVSSGGSSTPEVIMPIGGGASTSETTEPTTVDPEPVIPVIEPVTSDPEPDTPVIEPITSDPEPDSPVIEPVTSDPEPDSPVIEPVTSDPEPTIPVIESVTSDPEPTIPVIEPVTSDPEPAIPVIEPVTSDPEPSKPISEPDSPVSEPITPTETWVEPVNP